MSHESHALEFVDNVHITAQSGNGGAGLVSFRREKYIPKGGPDGGDGGNGGNVMVKATPHERTLRKLRYQSLYHASNGATGMAQKKHGKNGEDIVLSVPVGTLIRNAHDKRVVARLFKPHDSVVLLRGGIGGRGNVHFKNSVRQTPLYAQKGREGTVSEFIFELELCADASFIGLPNVGKSTLLKVLTNANPRIGNYPFTTLIPNVGTLVVRHKELVLLDIPGIVEGAAHGRGLGFHFLRHVKRSGVIFYVLDSSTSALGFVQQYATLWNELRTYSMLVTSRGDDVDLLAKPYGIVITKLDDSLYWNDTTRCVNEFMGALSQYMEEDEQRHEHEAMYAVNLPNIVCISAHTMYGMDALKELLVTSAEKN